MAANLERAMCQLQGERDTVAGLLQARRELIVSVSHELRTPMATLRGYLETTLNHWEDIPPATLQHDLQVMEDEVIRLQALVEDLFTLSRAEVGRLTLRCEATDVGMLVKRIVDARAPLAWRASRIEVAADVPGNVPPALVDASRLEQVLQNLLHNAVRHTPPGGIVAVALAAGANSIALQVKDTGEGIAPVDLPHIWERFYQASSQRTRTSSSAGLGLALVKELIEAMGGSVSVDSVVGEGSCFTIHLPQTHMDNASSTAASAARLELLD
jgi:signal transduction histidine kinase